MQEIDGARAAIDGRLAELRGELRAGEAQLEQLDRRRAQLRDTVLRIAGAIQVLEELLGELPGVDTALAAPASADAPVTASSQG